jgi:hypothetical protein
LECATAAIRVAKNIGWVKRDNIDLLHCNACEEPVYKIEIGWMTFRLGAWWTNYMRKAAEELAKKPRGDTVLESSLIDTALQQANRCQRCSERMEMKARFREFCEVLAVRVEQAISEVTLEIKL